MNVNLPDVIGEYVEGPIRHVTGGVQYAGYFDPDNIAPEQVTHLFVFLQNTFNVPVAVQIKVTLPQSGGLFRRSVPLLQIENPVIQINLSKAEAGLVMIPMTTTEHTKDGAHTVTLELKTSTQEKPERVRPAQSQSLLGRGFIDSAVGLNLAGTMGATFSEKSAKKVPFILNVAGKPAPAERAPRLQAKYQKIWVYDQMEQFNRVIHEINLREVKLQQELGLEPLYATLYAESTGRFADAGLPLRIGEAITLAKILTYSCQYFLSSPKRRNGLLTPIWEKAITEEINTTDVLQVIRSAGYHHILKLSIAISFGIIAKSIGRQLWPLVERQVVNSHIADSIEAGQNLEADFLYLPLLMAGVVVSNKLKLEGEDNKNTLALLQQAYEARADLFADADMAQANQIFTRLLKQAQQQK
jgi:hypothetical protein